MSEHVLRIGRICEKRGTQAMIAKATGISRPAVSRIVRGLEPPYPKRGRAIAAAVRDLPPRVVPTLEATPTEATA